MQTVVDTLIRTSEPMKAIWLDFYGEWAKDQRGIPYFILMTSFSGYIVNLFLNSDTASLKSIFAAVEDLYASRTRDVDMLLTSGLLEDTQRFLKIENIPLDSFVPFLGDRSKERWEAARKFLEEGREIPYE